MIDLTYSNPKNTRINKVQLYKYYAGFSDEFVKDILDLFLEENMTVLDPWNGSGTTTKVGSQYNNINLIGLDINPVMGIIARAQLISDKEDFSLKYNFKKYYTKRNIFNDPLENWFTKTTVANIRNIEVGLREYSEFFNNQKSFFTPAINSNIYSFISSDPKTSFVYLVLFSMLKKLVKKFVGSNPTWIKIAKEEKEKINLSQNKLEMLFKLEIENLIETVSQRKHNLNSANIELSVANSAKMKLKDKSVDLVISSPPYCTRIDYVVATRVELALLGLRNKEDFEGLRSNMIGTTKIINKDFHQKVSYSETATRFLEDVYSHDSRASKTYYIKQFFQYFESIFFSVKELTRVCKSKSKAVIVIQDSYYKEIYLDIFVIFEEIFENCGWSLVHKSDFRKKRTLAGINKESKKYRKEFSATESVLIFEKRSD